MGGQVRDWWRWGCFSKRDFRVARSLLRSAAERDFFAGMMGGILALENGNWKREKAALDAVNFPFSGRNSGAWV
jgi:hypothetical protein